MAYVERRERNEGVRYRGLYKAADGRYRSAGTFSTAERALAVAEKAERHAEVTGGAAGGLDPVIRAGRTIKEYSPLFLRHHQVEENAKDTYADTLVLERWGQLIDRASAGITDPAELFAVGTRITGRLGWTHPEIAGFLAGAGLDVLDIPIGLAPRALRDIEAGKAAGRFTVSDAEIALSAATGGMLGLFRMRQRHPERVTETTVDQLAEADLRMLGVPADEAARLTALPLPDTGTW